MTAFSATPPGTAWITTTNNVHVHVWNIGPGQNQPVFVTTIPVDLELPDNVSSIRTARVLSGALLDDAFKINGHLFCWFAEQKTNTPEIDITASLLTNLTGKFEIELFDWTAYPNADNFAAFEGQIAVTYRLKPDRRLILNATQRGRQIDFMVQSYYFFSNRLVVYSTTNLLTGPWIPVTGDLFPHQGRAFWNGVSYQADRCYYRVADADKDTDGDGLPDSEEDLIYGLNPYDSDCDGDGLPDGVEIAAGLNPQSSDSDQNGISDSSEDSDDDGYSNRTELYGGSAMHDATERIPGRNSFGDGSAEWYVPYDP